VTEPFAFSLWSALAPFLAFLPLLVGLRLALDRVEAAAARRARERREGTLEERLERAGADMRRARELLDGVEAELTARQTTLARLTADAQQWQRLAALHEAEARAVSGLVRHELGTAGRRGLVYGSLVNGAFFVLGFAVQVLA
jgi:hypothetical protein